MIGGIRKKQEESVQRQHVFERVMHSFTTVRSLRLDHESVQGVWFNRPTSGCYVWDVTSRWTERGYRGRAWRMILRHTPQRRSPGPLRLFGRQDYPHRYLFGAPRVGLSSPPSAVACTACGSIIIIDPGHGTGPAKLVPTPCRPSNERRLTG